MIFSTSIPDFSACPIWNGNIGTVEDAGQKPFRQANLIIVPAAAARHTRLGSKGETFGTSPKASPLDCDAAVVGSMIEAAKGLPVQAGAMHDAQGG
jgi:hypothetical protein